MAELMLKQVKACIATDTLLSIEIRAAGAPDKNHNTPVNKAAVLAVNEIIVYT